MAIQRKLGPGNRLTPIRTSHSEVVTVVVPDTFDVRFELVSYHLPSKRAASSKVEIEVSLSEDGVKFEKIVPSVLIHPAVGLAFGDVRVQVLLKQLKFYDYKSGQRGAGVDGTVTSLAGHAIPPLRPLKGTLEPKSRKTAKNSRVDRARSGRAGDSDEQAPYVDLGTKRKCPKCETKFYDLGSAIPKCPQCGNTTPKAQLVDPEKLRASPRLGRDDPRYESWSVAQTANRSHKTGPFGQRRRRR